MTLADKNKTSDNSDKQVTMYHDGECPMCNYEVKIMQKLDISKAIKWVDISTDKQALDEAGISYQQAMDSLFTQYFRSDLFFFCQIPT